MSIRSTAKAIVVDHGRVLLNLCQDQWNGEYYTLPGGGQETYETIAQALVRECREELDVGISVGNPFIEVTHAYPDLTVHLTLFHAEILHGVPKKLEHLDIRWITPKEISQYAFCPADAVILQAIQKMHQ